MQTVKAGKVKLGGGILDNTSSLQIKKKSSFFYDSSNTELQNKKRNIVKCKYLKNKKNV